MRAFLILLLLTLPALAEVPDYYPLGEHSSWTYQVDNGENSYRAIRTLTTVTDQNDASWDIHFTMVTPEARWVEWHRLHEGELFLFSISWPDENTIHGYEPPWPNKALHLSSPGQRTSYQGVVKEGEKSVTIREMTRVVEKEQVKVPAGSFEAVRVEVTQIVGNQLYRADEWYADGVGLVRSVVDDGQHETVTELVEYDIRPVVSP